MKLMVILHLIRNLKTKLKTISLAIAVRDIDMYESRTYMHCCLRRSRRFASGGVGCKGHERTRCTPHFRSTSHCDGDAKHRQDSCGEYNCLIQ